jgi:hypothetical protein
MAKIEAGAGARDAVPLQMDYLLNSCLVLKAGLVEGLDDSGRG